MDYESYLQKIRAENIAQINKMSLPELRLLREHILRETEGLDLTSSEGAKEFAESVDANTIGWMFAYVNNRIEDLSY